MHQIGLLSQWKVHLSLKYFLLTVTASDLCSFPSCQCSPNQDFQDLQDVVCNCNEKQVWISIVWLIDQTFGHFLFFARRYYLSFYQGLIFWPFLHAAIVHVLLGRSNKIYLLWYHWRWLEDYSSKFLIPMGNGCGLVGRAIALDCRGPQFESSHRQKIIMNIHCQLYWKDGPLKSIPNVAQIQLCNLAIIYRKWVPRHWPVHCDAK